MSRPTGAGPGNVGELRIDRRAADLAVEWRDLLTDQVEVEQRIQLTQQMARRNLVLEPEMVEQPLLTLAV